MSIVVDPRYACNSAGECEGATINGLSGAVILAAGSGITLTPVGQTITIASTGGGGGATTELDNLTTTAINTSLIPASDATSNLGSTTKKWTSLFAYDARDAGNSISVDFAGRQLSNSGNTTLMDWEFGQVTFINSLKLAPGNPTVAGPSIAAQGGSSNYTIALPTAQGTNGDTLVNDGSGVLSWASGGSGANTALSNLITTAINQDFIFDTGAPALITTKDDTAATQPMTLSSGNASAAAAGAVNISTGTSSSGNLSGTLNISTGVGTGGAGQSGSVNINSGVGTAGGASGNVNIASGVNSAQTGDVSIKSGNNNAGPTGAFSAKSGSSSVNGSGAVFYGSGDGAGANTGAVNITSGDAGVNSGNILLTVGVAGNTQGNIKLLKSGVPSVSGQIWTASSTDGAGYWADSSGTMVQTTVTLSSSDIINSPSTPIVVVPAVGGKVISLHSVAFQLNYGTTPYVLSPGANSFVSYSDDPTQQFNYVSLSDTGFLDATSNQEAIRGYVAGNSTNQLERSQGLSFFNNETTITAGDSTLTLIVSYFVLN